VRDGGLITIDLHHRKPPITSPGILLPDDLSFN